MDANGNIILSNSLPGTMGNMAPGMGIGSGYFQFDMNVLKKIRIRARAWSCSWAQMQLRLEHSAVLPAACGQHEY